MSSKRTPWSGSGRGGGLPGDGAPEPKLLGAGAVGWETVSRPKSVSRGDGVTVAVGARSADAEPGSTEEEADSGGDCGHSRTLQSKSVHTRARTGTGPAYWGGHALLGLVLGVAVLLTAGGFYLGRTTEPDPAGKPVVTTFVAASPQEHVTEPAPAPESAESAGTDSPEVGFGFVFGKVRANDGGTLTVHSEVTKAVVTVYTNDSTKMFVLIASDPAGIDIGAPVWIYGRKHADGTITARTIAGISMHGSIK